MPVVIGGDGIAHRLHEAVDQRGGQLGAGGGIDAAGRHEAVAQCLQEAGFPLRACLGQFGLGQRTRDTLPHVVNAALLALGVLLQQHLLADGLGGQGAGGRGREGGRRHGVSVHSFR
jgi:hypothetical protein